MVARPSFIIGGCAYRQQIHVQLAASIAHLAVVCGPGHERERITRELVNPQFGGIHFQHTSNLPQGRMLWLREQIESKEQHKWAVSVDSDTIFNAQHLALEMHRIDGATALGICPVRIGGTADLCNINITDADEQLSMTMDGGALAVANQARNGRRVKWGAELQKILEGSDRTIWSGGFGVAVFNLDWYRKNWPLPEPEYCSIATGEDTEHCRSVRIRGGRIEAMRVQTDHFAWGEKQTR